MYVFFHSFSLSHTHTLFLLFLFLSLLRQYAIDSLLFFCYSHVESVLLTRRLDFSEKKIESHILRTEAIFASTIFVGQSNRYGPSHSIERNSIEMQKNGGEKSPVHVKPNCMRHVLNWLY